MNTGLTLMQRYYGINTALNSYLQSKGQTCRVIKYGIDRATLKDDSDSQVDKYPYMQTFIIKSKPVTWTKYEKGILTDFDFQLSFFTSPENEFIEDSSYFYPFDIAKNSLSDINAQILKTSINGNITTLADLISMSDHYEFNMVSGSPVPAAFLIAKMRAVCGYVPDPNYTPSGYSTDLDKAINYNME